MMYPYMTLSDETEIVHSQLIEDKGIKKVIVNFERPTDNGFDSARCELPEYKWTEKEGYSDEEIAFFEKLPSPLAISPVRKMNSTSPRTEICI